MKRIAIEAPKAAVLRVLSGQNLFRMIAANLLFTRYEVIATSGRDRRHILHGADPVCSHVENRIADHVVRLGLLRQGHDHAAGPNDSDLLAGDFPYGVAKEFLMVERDIG